MRYLRRDLHPNLRRIPEMRRDTVAVIACAVIAALCVCVGAPGSGVAVVRGFVALAGATLAFVLPGYALAMALQARRSPDLAQLALLSVGGSVALTTLVGLLLNLTPWGLRPASWAVALGTVTVACALAGEWRRGTHATAAPVTAATPVTLTTRRQLAPALASPRWRGLVSRAALLYGLAALVVAFAVGVASAGADDAATLRSTRLWVVPANAGKTEIRLGVENGEGVPVRYALRVGSGNGIVGEWPDIALGPGGRWEASLDLATVSPEDTTVEALLYRDDDLDVPFRTVTVTVR